MKAARVDILLKETVPGSSFFFFLPPFRQERRRGKRKERKKKKNFRKYLEDILKSSYLCIRFLKRTAIVKRAIFEQIYINNTSSTRASGYAKLRIKKLRIKEACHLGKTKEPSISVLYK